MPGVDGLELCRRIRARSGDAYTYVILVTSMGDHRDVLEGMQAGAGEEALRRVADTLVATLRQADAVYRYGGEEFLAILPEATLDSATAAFERVRRAIAEQGLSHTGGPGGVITISAGVSAFDPGGEKTPEALLKEADVALYRAKDAGRNQVVAYAP